MPTIGSFLLSLSPFVLSSCPDLTDLSLLPVRWSPRETAIELMKAALSRYRVQGLGNNMCFLQDIMRNKEYDPSSSLSSLCSSLTSLCRGGCGCGVSFASGNYGTGFIKEHYPNGFTGVKLSSRETAELIAGASCIHHATLESKKSVLVTAPEDDSAAPRHEYIVLLGGSHGSPYHVNMGTSADGTGMHVFIKGAAKENVSHYHLHPLPSCHSSSPLCFLILLNRTLISVTVWLRLSSMTRLC
jgi:hypothetical protein